MTANDEKGTVVVPPSMTAAEANRRYGDAFGVDWVYPEPAMVTVRADDLRRTLMAVDIAATNDGDLLSGYQERAVMTLRRTMRDAGHLCLMSPVEECPACMDNTEVLARLTPPPGSTPSSEDGAR